MRFTYKTYTQDYHAFGNVMAGRSFSNEKYRFGFNEMEKDNETFTDVYDFGARILDTRIGRWLAVDPQSAKYCSLSPFHFGNNNPIITIDPNGEENIIVIGGKDKKPNDKADKMKFVNTGLSKLTKHLQNEKNESTTIALFDKGLTAKHVYKLKQKVFWLNIVRKNNLNLEIVKTPKELVNYINSKNISSKELSNNRTSDKITDITFFGHGYSPDFGGSGNIESTFEVGHGHHKLNTTEHDNLTFDSKDISNISTSAFLQSGSNCVFYSCNAATENPDGNCLAKSMSEKMGENGKVTAWKGRTDYSNMYGNFSFDNSKDKDGITSDCVMPVAGTQDNGEDSIKITYKGGKKQ